MKKTLLTICFYLCIVNAFSQWNINGTHINNSNIGYVGIGTTSPAFKLDVNGNLRTTSFAAIREYLTVDNGGSYRVALNGQSDGYITARNSNGDDKFTITTNGNSYFNGGNVGIGTNNPMTPFHVEGTSGLQQRISITGAVPGAANASVDMVMGSGANYGYAAGMRAFVGGSAPGIDRVSLGFYTTTYSGALLSRIDRMYISDVGNVGVGVYPTTRFHVNGDAGVHNRLTVNNPSTGTQGGSFDITMGSGSSYDYAAGIRGYVPANASGIDRVYLGFYTTTYSGTLQSRIERMTITDNGNVGIGTSTPQGKLDVIGASYFSGGRLTLTASLPNDNNATFVNNDASGYGIYSKGGLSTRYAFHFENQAGNSIMFGAGNGNVGIGTTNPDAKLAVKGTVHAEEVKVDLQVPGPDYVFEPTYQLPTLTEIENYIKANKHLPEVPSAKEMETNGINLSEMNMLLLKKVEELTLYLIESEKRNAEYEKRLKSLELKLSENQNK